MKPLARADGWAPLCVGPAVLAAFPQELEQTHTASGQEPAASEAVLTPDHQPLRPASLPLSPPQVCVP